MVHSRQIHCRTTGPNQLMVDELLKTYISYDVDGKSFYPELMVNGTKALLLMVEHLAGN